MQRTMKAVHMRNRCKGDEAEASSHSTHERKRAVNKNTSKAFQKVTMPQQRRKRSVSQSGQGQANAKRICIIIKGVKNFTQPVFTSSLVLSKHGSKTPSVFSPKTWSKALFLSFFVVFAIVMVFSFFFAQNASLELCPWCASRKLSPISYIFSLVLPLSFLYLTFGKDRFAAPIISPMVLHHILRLVLPPLFLSLSPNALQG